MKYSVSQNLLIDADDTLWENNIYFEQVIEKTHATLARFGVDRLAFRTQLNETELRYIPIYGYGTENFTRSLMETFQSFLPPGSDPSLPDQIRKTALAIMDHPLEFLEGVPETLEYLTERHALYLVTKGDIFEQAGKIEASGLRDFFRGVEILGDKNTAAYKELLTRHAWDADRTWMIGNSPRSDINPAIGAGLRAIYIPHRNTWILEHEEPVQHPNLVHIKGFPDLRAMF